MSLRASASLPSSCSGAMYWNVPTIIPAPVSGVARVGVWLSSTDGPGELPAAAAFGPMTRASPKSSSLAPDLVSMTFEGLRSRCTIPCRWALSSASAISAA